jgi:hypothetical protein
VGTGSRRTGYSVQLGGPGKRRSQDRRKWGQNALANVVERPAKGPMIWSYGRSTGGATRHDQQDRFRRRGLWPARRGDRNVRRKRRQVRFRIKSPPDTLDLMKLQCPSDSLPQIAVANRHLPPESLPMPLFLAPLIQFAPNAARYIAAAGDERDLRGLVERFQAANDRKQLQPAPAVCRLTIGSAETVAAADRPQRKLPPQLAGLGGRFREKQVVRAARLHRRIGQSRGRSIV